VNPPTPLLFDSTPYRRHLLRQSAGADDSRSPRRRDARSLHDSAQKCTGLAAFWSILRFLGVPRPSSKAHHRCRSLQPAPLVPLPALSVSTRAGLPRPRSCQVVRGRYERQVSVGRQCVASKSLPFGEGHRSSVAWSRMSRASYGSQPVGLGCPHRESLTLPDPYGMCQCRGRAGTPGRSGPRRRVSPPGLQRQGPNAGTRCRPVSPLSPLPAVGHAAVRRRQHARHPIAGLPVRRASAPSAAPSDKCLSSGWNSRLSRHSPNGASESKSIPINPASCKQVKAFAPTVDGGSTLRRHHPGVKAWLSVTRSRADELFGRDRIAGA